MKTVKSFAFISLFTMGMVATSFAATVNTSATGITQYDEEKKECSKKKSDCAKTCDGKKK